MPKSNKRPVSADRRAQVRAEQLRLAAAAKRRRTITQLAIIGGVAVLVITIVVVAVVVGNRDRGDAVAPQVNTTVPLGGAQVPLAVAGSAVRLGPADAPARVDLWVDYSCSHCQDFEAENNATLNQLVAAGKVSVSYHNIEFVSRYGGQAGSASGCVAAQDPAAWPAFNSALYANHSSQTDGWTAGEFRDFAGQQGVNAAAQTCIAKQTYTGWIDANTADAAEQKVTGTPTMFLNGEPTALLGGAALTQKVNELAGR